MMNKAPSRCPNCGAIANEKMAALLSGLQRYACHSYWLDNALRASLECRVRVLEDKAGIGSSARQGSVAE